MLWVIGFLAVVVVVFGIIIATGRLGGMSGEPIRDVYAPVLPEGGLSPADLRGLKLGVSAQGYSMSQVDSLLDRLAGEIAERDRIIEELRREDHLDESAPEDISPADEGLETVTEREPEPIGNNGGDR